MKYQLEITTLLVPVNVHQLFEKCEWPELNCFDREMVEGYFSDLVNGIQTDEALDDWTLTVVLYIGTYLGANSLQPRDKELLFNQKTYFHGLTSERVGDTVYVIAEEVYNENR